MYTQRNKYWLWGAVAVVGPWVQLGAAKLCQLPCAWGSLRTWVRFPLWSHRFFFPPWLSKCFSLTPSPTEAGTLDGETGESAKCWINQGDGCRMLGSHGAPRVGTAPGCCLCRRGVWAVLGNDHLLSVPKAAFQSEPPGALQSLEPRLNQLQTHCLPRH